MSTAAALAVALPATGLIIAVVLATGRLTWNGLSGRIGEQGKSLDEQGQRLGALESQQGEILQALGRLDEHGHRLAALESQQAEILRQQGEILRQQGEILRALGRLEGRRDAETEAAA